MQLQTLGGRSEAVGGTVYSRKSRYMKYHRPLGPRCIAATSWLFVDSYMRDNTWIC